MTPSSTLPSFEPNAPDAAGIVSWAHLGDLHITLPGEENHRHLLSIVSTLNEAFGSSLAFAFLPGDIANEGSIAQYEIVRSALDELKLPWCAIVGDHDVHEKSFTNFREFMSDRTHYHFVLGQVHFFALNAFDLPDPGSFTLLSDQLAWLEQGLTAMQPGESAVLFLHCYPSELKQGGGTLRSLIERFPVRLVDMGHTHYNEVANDGNALYSATRSTGQIEEGPAGFSVTNLDGAALSWKFFPLGSLPALMITSPADERLITDREADSLVVDGALRIRAKAWSTAPVQSVVATVDGNSIPLKRVGESNVWQAVTTQHLADGVHTLEAELTDAAGNRATDAIRFVAGKQAWKPVQRAERDLDNAVDAWPERGLLATQLGPNKNGRKW